jgi:hypothetical protein
MHRGAASRGPAAPDAADVGPADDVLGDVAGEPLRIGHVRRRRRLTDALGRLPGPGLLEL